jgi:hypothetical protein
MLQLAFATRESQMPSVTLFSIFHLQHASRDSSNKDILG